MIEISKIELLLSANSNNLKELSLLMGYDPVNFYVGTDLSGTNLEGQDLRGMNLNATNLLDANIDYFTQFDDEINQLIRKKTKMRYLLISTDLVIKLDKLAQYLGYHSRGWLIKAIVPQGAKEINNDIQRWQNILSSPSFDKYLYSTNRTRMELKLRDLDYKVGHSFARKFKAPSAGVAALIMAGVISEANTISSSDNFADFDSAISFIINDKSAPKRSDHF